MTSTTPVLSIRDLSVSFRTAGALVPAVTGVSIDVAAGQTVAVVGESGSGKSTTAAAVNRLLPANGRVVGGRVLLDGRDLLDLPENAMVPLRGAEIGLVPQDPMSNLNPLMRVGTQIAEALEVHGRAQGKAAWDKAVELLDMVGIPDPGARARQHPHEFSGGMRQRALIAMGLACRPHLLIADEPTSALDVTVQLEVLAILDKLVAERGMGLIFISHDLRLVSSFCDRVLVMYAGRVVEELPASRLSEAQHPYTRGLLNCLPQINADRHPLPVLERQAEWAQ